MSVITSRLRPSALGLYTMAYIAFLYLPVLMIPLFSLNDSIYVSFPLKGLTTQWYVGLWHNDGLHAAFLNSVKVGLCAASVATLCGTLTAYAVTRRSSWPVKALARLALAPMAVPGIVTGVAILVVINLSTLGPSLIAVTIGHISVCLPLVIVVMKSRFQSYPASLEEAAYDLGASEWQTLVRVSLPVVAPGIIASFLLAFTLSFDEFIVTFFLTGTEPTLPIFIWNQLRFSSRLPEILALGSVILLGSIILVLVAEFIRHRGEKRQFGVP